MGRTGNPKSVIRRGRIGVAAIPRNGLKSAAPAGRQNPQNRNVSRARRSHWWLSASRARIRTASIADPARQKDRNALRIIPMGPRNRAGLYSQGKVNRPCRPLLVRASKRALTLNPTAASLPKSRTGTGMVVKEQKMECPSCRNRLTFSWEGNKPPNPTCARCRTRMKSAGPITGIQRKKNRNRNRRNDRLPAIPMPERPWFKLDGATSGVVEDVASLVYQSKDQCPYHYYSLEKALIHFDEFWVCQEHLQTESMIKVNHGRKDCDACCRRLRKTARRNNAIGRRGKLPDLCPQHRELVKRFWN